MHGLRTQHLLTAWGEKKERVTTCPTKTNPRQQVFQARRRFFCMRVTESGWTVGISFESDLMDLTLVPISTAVWCKSWNFWAPKPGPQASFVWSVNGAREDLEIDFRSIFGQLHLFLKLLMTFEFVFKLKFYDKCQSEPG